MGVSRVKNPFFKITVCFQEREDGGLRAWSDDVPGFVLSHPDPQALIDDIEPALETILTAVHGTRVLVAPLLDPNSFEQEPCLPMLPAAPLRCLEYASQRLSA